MCSKEARCTVCVIWTDVQWKIYKSRRHLYKQKVGGLFPSKGGSALVFHSVQDEVHALFVVDGTVPPLLIPCGSLTHCPKEKAALLADVFESKQSNGSLTMPQSCFPEVELTTFAFRSGEVKKLLLELDPYGGAGPDSIFPLLLSSKDF